MACQSNYKPGLVWYLNVADGVPKQ